MRSMQKRRQLPIRSMLLEMRKLKTKPIKLQKILYQISEISWWICIWSAFWATSTQLRKMLRQVTKYNRPISVLTGVICWIQLWIQRIFSQVFIVYRRHLSNQITPWKQFLNRIHRLLTNWANLKVNMVRILIAWSSNAQVTRSAMKNSWISLWPWNSLCWVHRRRICIKICNKIKMLLPSNWANRLKAIPLGQKLMQVWPRMLMIGFLNWKKGSKQSVKNWMIMRRTSKLL